MRSRASAMIARTRATPSVTAENATKVASPRLARSRASVVLPLPGGPQRMRLERAPPSSMRLSGLPSARRRACPANSASVRGRIRAARGAPAPAVDARPERASWPAGAAPLDPSEPTPVAISPKSVGSVTPVSRRCAKPGRGRRRNAGREVPESDHDSTPDHPGPDRADERARRRNRDRAAYPSR